jgi:hypothetical protein
LGRRLNLGRERPGSRLIAAQNTTASAV